MYPVKVAVELVGPTDPGAAPAARARAFALERVREHALQANGWLVLRLTEAEWQQAGAGGGPGARGAGEVKGLSSQHQRVHYLLARLKQVLGADKPHKHTGSCGCH